MNGRHVLTSQSIQTRAPGRVRPVDAEGLAERADREIDALGEPELVDVALPFRPEDAAA